MSGETGQKKVLYRTLSGQENSRWMQDNESQRFKNVNTVNHPNYGEVYPEPDENWSGTSYAQGRGPLSPETTAAAKKFRFIDVGSMNNPLIPVSYRRVTGRPIETPMVQPRQTVSGVNPPGTGANPPIPNNPVAAGNTPPQKKPLPVISFGGHDTYPNGGQKEPSPSVAGQNPFAIQPDLIKKGFQDNPMIKQYLPEYVDRSSKLEKKNVKYLDFLGEVKTRDMSLEEESSYRDIKPNYVPEKGMVYPDINQQERLTQYPYFDVTTLYSTSSNFVPRDRQKVLDALGLLNSNPYYNRLFYDLSKAGAYNWGIGYKLRENDQAGFEPENNKIGFKDNKKILPQNIEEEMLHAAQKQAYGVDTMVNQKEKFRKTLEFEAKVYQDYIRKLNDIKPTEGKYPDMQNSGTKTFFQNPEYESFLVKIAQQGGFTKDDMEEYYNWGRKFDKEPGEIDPDFSPQLLLRYFGKKE